MSTPSAQAVEPQLAEMDTLSPMRPRVQTVS